MVFPSHGKHLSRDFALGKISQIGRDFGMIASKKRLGRSLREQAGGSEENLALVSKTRKGKGKSSSKKGNSDGGSSQPGKKKDLSKIKCFSCHKNGHYASQCPEKKKKGNGKMHRQQHQQRHNLMSLQQSLRRITHWFLSFLPAQQQGVLGSWTMVHLII
jgi:hypothetical protein